MSSPFIGEIRIFGFNFAPRNWAFCNGAILAISSNSALFSILGVTYGGNGSSTFGLPNFNNNASLHWGSGPGLSPYVLGQASGTPSVTLTTQQMPSHNHTLAGGTVVGGPTQVVAGPSSTSIFGISGPGKLYDATGPGTPVAPFSPLALGAAGGNQPHENRQPFLTMNFCICLSGVFPARN